MINDLFLAAYFLNKFRINLMKNQIFFFSLSIVSFVKTLMSYLCVTLDFSDSLK